MVGVPMLHGADCHIFNFMSTERIAVTAVFYFLDPRSEYDVHWNIQKQTHKNVWLSGTGGIRTHTNL